MLISLAEINRGGQQVAGAGIKGTSEVTYIITFLALPVIDR